MIAFQKVETEQHLKSIEQLARAIWTLHYTPIIGLEQVEYMLTKFQSFTAMQQQIKEGYEYYMINYRDEFVGYLSIKKNKNVLFLSKIYVHSDYRGKGIGKTAFRFIENRALDLACNSIMLTVNKYNSNSIAAYKRLGYKIIEELVIDIGNGYVMDDFKFEKRFQ
jgi:RimJ/RimL family protein N-acetyltransferase